MSMPKKPSDIEEYLINGCGRCDLCGTPQCKVVPWRNHLKRLRKTVLTSGLTETIKWGAPCYTYKQKNILMLSALKDAVVISFFRGNELPDPGSRLEKPGEHSRFARYLRFRSSDDIEAAEAEIQHLIQAAITLEQSGRKIQAESDIQPMIPEELKTALKNCPALKTAFEALTPGRQRGYLIYFSSAKRSQTRRSRIEKCMSRIIEGKGWNER